MNDIAHRGCSNLAPPLAWTSLMRNQSASVFGLIPSSAANSAVVRPLSRHRSTRFAHSSRTTRVRFCFGLSMSASLRHGYACSHDALSRTDTRIPSRPSWSDVDPAPRAHLSGSYSRSTDLSARPIMPQGRALR
jgi:hypothetical protein